MARLAANEGTLPNGYVPIRQISQAKPTTPVKPVIAPLQVRKEGNDLTSLNEQDDSMGFLKNLVGKVTSGVKNVVKFAGNIASVIQNPIKAASDALTSGAASANKSTKEETKQSIDAQKATKNNNVTTSQGGGIMGWLKGTWTVFGLSMARWMWLGIVIIIIIGIIYYLKHRVKKAVGRRRTFAARRARVAKRRTVRRKK